MTDFTIQRCRPGDSRYQATHDLAAALRQTSWLTADHAWHLESHLLIAVVSNRPVGFLRFVVQQIGPECDRPSITKYGEPLREAKVLAFGVAEDQRRRGVGTALQKEMIRLATTLGCYQVRSRSGGKNVANHALKLSLGFGVHPTTAEDAGVFFVLPLAKDPDANASS